MFINENNELFSHVFVRFCSFCYVTMLYHFNYL